MNYLLQDIESDPEDQFGPPRILVLSSSEIALRTDAACRLVFNPHDEFEGILLLAEAKAKTVETLVRQSNAYLVPIANLTQTPLPFDDFHPREQTAETIGEAIDVILRIVTLIRALPEYARFSDTPETILLARAYSRKRVIEPAYDPSVRDCVIYPAAGLVDDPGRRAERMTNAGYFTRMFFDRLHACPNCGSSRLNAREECISCRSADLAEESLIHHLLCDYRGLEAGFRQGPLLICPACRLEVGREGDDFEGPVHAHVCRCCGHVASQASLGFVCIDCQARHDSEAIATRDFYKYELTRKGERALLSNEPWEPRETSAAGPSPQEATIRQALRLHSRYGRPLAILRISFGSEKWRPERGTLVSSTQASLRIGAVLRAETRETDIVTEAENGFLVYLPETPSNNADALNTRLRKQIGASLPADVDVRITALRPKDLDLSMIETV